MKPVTYANMRHHHRDKWLFWFQIIKHIRKFEEKHRARIDCKWVQNEFYWNGSKNLILQPKNMPDSTGIMVDVLNSELSQTFFFKLRHVTDHKLPGMVFNAFDIKLISTMKTQKKTF